MSITVILLIIILISFVANFLTIKLFAAERKKRFEAQEESVKAKSDLEYYMVVNEIKKEVKKENAEKNKSLSSGDVHSRNSAAASILRNNKND